MAGEILATESIGISTTTKSITYTVKNNCFLSILPSKAVDIIGDNGTRHVGIFVNDVEIFKFNAFQTADDSDEFNLLRWMPMKQGTRVKMMITDNSTGKEFSGSVGLMGNGSGTSCNIIFTEAKLT